MIAWMLFYNPMMLGYDRLLWLVIPLCAGVAIVYKTVRTQDVSRLHVEILELMAYIVVGLAALGVGLWLIEKFWP